MYTNEILNRSILPLLRAQELLEGDRVHAAEYVSSCATLTTKLWLIVGPESSTSTGPGVAPGFPTSATEVEKEDKGLVRNRNNTQFATYNKC